MTGLRSRIVHEYTDASDSGLIPCDIPTWALIAAPAALVAVAAATVAAVMALGLALGLV